MTPVEKLTAAIDVLERLKDDSTPGDWEILDGGDRFIAWHADPESAGFEYILHEPVEFERPADAELIVTLHATIPAQLAILQTSITLDGLVPMHQALALADAILGPAHE